MPVTHERENGVLTIRLQGRINSADANVFQHDLNTATDSGDQAVVMDMESLDYISSGGLRVLLEYAQALEIRGARFAVCSPAGSVQEVFRISGFEQILTICATHDDAVVSVSR